MTGFVRIAGVVPALTAAAIGFAHEVAAYTYMKSACCVELEAMHPSGGNPQRIAWAARYEDLAAGE